MLVDSNHYCGSCFIAPKENKKFKKCGGCKKIRYCSKVCQRKHWPFHKLGCSALLKEGHVTPVKVDINSLNAEGMSRLHVAASNNDCLTSRNLLEHGASLDCLSGDNRTPLYYAVESGHEQIVKLIMDYCCREHMEICDVEVLEKAFKLKRQDIVLMLIPDGNISYFEDIILMAAEYGACQVFDVLLDRLERDEELLKEKSRYMIAAYELAALKKRHKFLEHLLKLEILPLPQLYDEALALKSATLLKLLAGHGLPLHHCLKRNYPEALEIFLENGADVNKVDEFGYTPLYCAIEKGSLQMVNLLLFHGAGTTHLSQMGDSACQLAIIFGDQNLLRTLIDHHSIRKDGDEHLQALRVARDEGAVALLNFLYEHRWSKSKKYHETLKFIEAIMGKKITEPKVKEAVLRIVLSKQQ